MQHRTLTRFVGLALLALTCLLVWQLYQSRELAIERANDTADRFSQALRVQFDATLRRLDSDLHAVSGRISAQALNTSQPARYASEVSAILAPYTQRFPEMGDFFVWDAQGSLLYGTHGETSSDQHPVSIGQRENFKRLLAGSDNRLLFSDAIRGVVTGRFVVAAYCPIRDAEGHLIGVVTGTIDLDRLSQGFQLLQMPVRSVIILRRSDNQRLIAREPPLDNELNKATSNAIQRRIDAGEMEGRDRFASPVDGEPRLYGFRRLESYPFYLVVGLSESEALADWQRNAFVVLVFLGLTICAVVVMLRRIGRDDMKRASAQREAAHAHALMRDAINSVSAGIVIYDDKDSFVACNDAHRQMFAPLSDALEIGMTHENLLDLGLQRHLFQVEPGTVASWRERRIRDFHRADGQRHEIELTHGEWVMCTEHRTPLGYTVGVRIEITERKRLEQELREQASTDGLTGLPNRRYFMRRLEDEVDRVRRGSTREACLLMLDLDYFKRVNDQHGHVTGDSLLQHFAKLLRAEMRSTDLAGRLGGEEFAVLLPGSSAPSAVAWAQRLCAHIASQPLRTDGKSIAFTVSVGIAAISVEDAAATSVFTRADAALYQAKDAGRNRVELATPP